jgi:TPR repeat protein
VIELMSSIADVAKREKKEKKERKEKKKEKKMATTGTNGNSYPMEMESLADFTEEEDDPEEELPTAFKYLMNPMAFIQNLFALIAAYASYYRNITIPVSVIAIILVVILTLDFVAAASTTAHVAGVERDYTDAHSVYELKMQQIDHWCLAVSYMSVCLLERERLYIAYVFGWNLDSLFTVQSIIILTGRR